MILKRVYNGLGMGTTSDQIIMNKFSSLKGTLDNLDNVNVQASDFPVGQDNSSAMAVSCMLVPAVNLIHSRGMDQNQIGSSQSEKRTVFFVARLLTCPQKERDSFTVPDFLRPPAESPTPAR